MSFEFARATTPAETEAVQPRDDLDAATDDTRILSPSECALRTMIAEEPTIAAKVLLNLSTMLCVRLARAG